MFWLFLILRIAKNIVFSNIVADERSDDEDDDEDVEIDGKDDKGAVENTKLNGTKPVVLLNGAPIGGEPKPDGVRERKRQG